MTFNSQICTTREQSERLLSLGLKEETADCYWFYCDIAKEWKCTILSSTQVFKDYPTTVIPAWSLGRLWELYWSNKVVSDCLFGCGKYMNPYAKMIAMIEYDIEDGTFNKDYLI